MATTAGGRLGRLIKYFEGISDEQRNQLYKSILTEQLNSVSSPEEPEVYLDGIIV